MEDLKNELRELIISTLEMEDVSPDDIEDDTILFGDGLGLDSIDALELGMALRKTYGIRINGKTNEVRQNFATISSLAEFVAAHRQAPE